RWEHRSVSSDGPPPCGTFRGLYVGVVAAHRNSETPKALSRAPSPRTTPYPQPFSSCPTCGHEDRAASGQCQESSRRPEGAVRGSLQRVTAGLEVHASEHYPESALPSLSSLFSSVFRDRARIAARHPAVGRK